MKRSIPIFPPKAFHRIRATNPRALDDMIAKRTTDIVNQELAQKFKIGDGLVVASGDEIGPAKVEALGVVIGIGASGQREVEWTSVQFKLPKSTLQGGHFWTQPKPTFKFSETVAERFRLKHFFNKFLKDPFPRPEE
ncbi:MAG: hypothetical protein Q7S17_10610 [Xanthobacteraceae bacterium]|nr:hypothetical protein [Xanthobacteraceae bacterium]